MDVEQQVTRSERKKKPCNNGPSCLRQPKCDFLHDTADFADIVPAHSSNRDQDLRRMLCKRNLKCTKSECPYGHRSRVAPANIEVMLDIWCSYDEKCSNTKCNRNHRSPVVGRKAAGKKRGRRGGNARTYKEKRAKPRFDTKVMSDAFAPPPPSYHSFPPMQIEDEEKL